jgi:hypothetical protein
MLTSDIYDQRPAIDAGRSLVAHHRLALAALAEEPIKFAGAPTISVLRASLRALTSRVCE